MTEIIERQKTPKKRFGVNTKNIAKTIDQANQAERLTKFRSALIACNDIDLDENNPRELALTRSDITAGINKSDPDYSRKQDEFEKIKSLSYSIQKDSLLQPILVYKDGSRYKIVAGERRFLATLLSGLTNIEARIYLEKPSELDLKSAQWVENNQREDLSLHERIKNIKDIVETYEKVKKIKCVMSTLAQLTGLSESQAAAYLRVIKSDDKTLHAVKSGKIDSLDKTLCILSVDDAVVRGKLIDLCASGLSLKAMRDEIKVLQSTTTQELDPENKLTKDSALKKRGRKATKVSFGSTSKIEVVNELLFLMKKSEKYREAVAEALHDLHITDHDTAAAAFKKMIRIIEKSIG